ncbi:glutathione S-transferase [Pseudomonas sp. CrR25]|nr:glutathione S-transferase [Pseudomonas sp. CrR25]
MLKIWGRKNSSNVRKVLWCAEEAGLAYQAIDAGGAFGLVNEAAYRAKNPNGLIPLIEDGDLLLWESNAIVRYLAAQYAPGSLYPLSPALRAEGDKWMDWVSASLIEPFSTLFVGTVRTPPERRDAAQIARALERCGELLAIPERALASRPYLSGDTFAMGDIPLGCIAYAWFEMPIVRPELPHLAAWYARLQERPAYRRGVMTPLT